jgi:hypothetical protein
MAPKPKLPAPGTVRVIRLKNGTLIRVKYVNSKKRRARAAQ